MASDEVLSHFSNIENVAKSKYIDYLVAGLSDTDPPDLTGGGLVRSCGGWEQVRQLRSADLEQKSDERILGDSKFVENVLSFTGENLKQRINYSSRGIDFSKLSLSLATFFNVDEPELLSASKKTLCC